MHMAFSCHNSQDSGQLLWLCIMLFMLDSHLTSAVLCQALYAAMPKCQLPWSLTGVCQSEWKLFL